MLRSIPMAWAINIAQITWHMHVPSRLNEYPIGTTNPTTCSEQPAYSSFLISEGSAVSEDVVARTTNISSFKYRRYFHRLNPLIQQIEPSTKMRKKKQLP